MAYIDVDKFAEKICNFQAIDEDAANKMIWLLRTFPTADVVPKSEVDELICKLECFLCHVTGGRLSKHTYELRTMETVATDCINETYNDGYGEGYKDCAREIFEEIERLLELYTVNTPIHMPFNYIDILFVHYVAELKKKYTEGGE